ncbi:MAG: NAD-dependent deacylase [Planctomycetota bacterium]
MTDIERVADWLRQAERAVVFTGAGMSTESGIPDFRSPGGVWAKNDPVYFDDFVRSQDARNEYWRQKSEAHREFHIARPNPAHQAVARWEQIGRIRGVITQNIDGLHQEAGSKHVLELHGTARFVSCLQCEARFAADEWVTVYLERRIAPDCPECRGPLKHATISFGQALPTDVLMEAQRWADRSDLFIVMGSSLVVYPAAGLPVTAKRAGSRLVILNRDETPLDHAADAVLRGGLGETVSAIEALLI